jgi:TPR repeat protein/antitoxin component YwqK of YwqJK toxin-antitoxin module
MKKLLILIIVLLASALYFHDELKPILSELKVAVKSLGDDKNGEKGNLVVNYFENGQVSSKGILKNGKEEGVWVRYHENGQLFYKSNYKSGKSEGAWVIYHSNGQLNQKGNYKSGKSEGAWVEYWDNGQLISKGTYKNGKKNGAWVYYFPDGTVDKNLTGTYKNGEKEGSIISMISAVDIKDSKERFEGVCYKKLTVDPTSIRNTEANNGDSSSQITLIALKNTFIQIRESKGGWLIVTRTLYKGQKYNVPRGNARTLTTDNAGGLDIRVDGVAVPKIGHDGMKLTEFVLDAHELENSSNTEGGSISNDGYQKGLKALKRGDFKTTLREWGALAEQGDLFAHTNLGMMYVRGDGVAQDCQKAMQWLLKASDLGHNEAKYQLGKMFHDGVGMPKNNERAIAFWITAAEKGHARAQSDLGMMYANGNGVKRDDKAALKWFLLAAEQGRVVAQSNLGVMYQFGYGVQQSYVNAAKWFELAANQGNTIAKKQLGIVLTELGRDLRKDNKSCSDMYACKKALAYYYRAAEVQNTDAMAYISSVLWTMEKKITPKVHMWLVLSDRVGIKDPQRRQDIQKGLAELKDNTSLNNTVQQLADECIQKKYKGC